MTKREYRYHYIRPKIKARQQLWVLAYCKAAYRAHNAMNTIAGMIRNEQVKQYAIANRDMEAYKKLMGITQ